MQAKEDGFAPGLPIVSPQDPASSHWTPVCPSPQTVNRLVALASRSLRIVEVSPSSHAFFWNLCSKDICLGQHCVYLYELHKSWSES